MSRMTQSRDTPRRPKRLCTRLHTAKAKSEAPFKWLSLHSKNQRHYERKY